MAKAVFKVSAFLAMIIILSGILIVAVARARHEGKLLYCKNNLRYLGILYDNYITSIPDPLPDRGRKFWHTLIKELGEDKKNPDAGGWASLACPVLGLTRPGPQDPSAVDYRGPHRSRESYGPNDPIAADRAGNHGDHPGWVLLHSARVDGGPGAVNIVQDEELWNKSRETTVD